LFNFLYFQNCNNLVFWMFEIFKLVLNILAWIKTRVIFLFNRDATKNSSLSVLMRPIKKDILLSLLLFKVPNEWRNISL
jgi:hypothetical protein